MNERIEKFAEEAKLSYVMVPNNPFIKEDLQKFAELIIKECANIANNNFNTGFCPVGEFITNYFGIE